jgi:hypothetical protein
MALGIAGLNSVVRETITVVKTIPKSNPDILSSILHG